MRIGLFGGTFDPIHIGHLIIAETAYSDLPLDRLIFIPALIPPHKTDMSITDSKHRMNMILLGINDHPNFECSNLEVLKNVKSYTIDTIKIFKSDFPDDTLFFIMGSDSLADIHTWHEPEMLISTVQIIVAPRPGVDLNHVNSSICNSVRFISTPLIDINSSMIRKRIHEHKSIQYLVPSLVEKYIYDYGLYLG